MQLVKMNDNLLGNSVLHLHTHIVPRYRDDPSPGWPFPFPDQEPPSMAKDRRDADVAALRAILVKARRSDDRTGPVL